MKCRATEKNSVNKNEKNIIGILEVIPPSSQLCFKILDTFHIFHL
jgi:hypothetical protein